MTVIGHARASTTDQDLSIQENALRAAGCEVIRAEKRSGSSTAGREELRTVLGFMGKGDVLMVTRIDRLARSIGDLQDIVRAIKAKADSRSTPGPRPALPRGRSSARRNCVASGSLTVLRRPRRKGCTRVARPRSTWREYAS